MKYSTPDEQIKHLKERNLIITDENYAREQLICYGYSNLIKSYREPYVIRSSEHKDFRSGITFEQVCSLYELDKNLRNGVIAAMLDLEEHLKAVTADVLAHSFGTHQDDYLKFKNYRDKKKRNKNFTLGKILSDLNKALLTDKNPIKHYREAHGIVPPWILFKNAYLSTIVNLIGFLKKNEQEQVAIHLYGEDIFNQDPEHIRELMVDTLAICLEYRNLAAHGGRIYNHECTSNCRGIEHTSSFKLLLTVLSFLKYDAPFLKLEETLNDEVNRHCRSFPEDVTYLGNILDMNIETHSIVWVTEKGNLFHINPHCSGIKTPIETEFDFAIQAGYRPCKRCCFTKDIE